MLGYIGSISAPDKATLKEEAHAPPGPTMLHLLTSLERDPCAASEVTDVDFVSSVLLPVSERQPAPVRSPMALLKFEHLANTLVPLFMLTLPNGKKG